MNNKIVSVIIPYSQKNERIKNTLSSLCKQKSFDTSKIEVIVVDSTDENSSRVIIGDLPICKVINDKNIRNEAEAFNMGLNAAVGEYIAFMHCGDKVSRNFFQSCTASLKTYTNVPFVTCPSFCINPVFNKSVPCKMDKIKFESSGIVNVKKNYLFIMDTVCNSLFRKSTFENRRFNTELLYESEQDFILNLLLESPSYALTDDCNYQYFMPREDDFQYHLPANYKDWYTPSLKNFILPLLNKCSESYGEIPDFIQFYTMYALQGKFLSNLNNRNKRTMDANELNKFFDTVSEVLQNIDDVFILNRDKTPILTYSEEAGQMFEYIKYGINKELPLYYAQGKDEVYLNCNDVFIARLSNQRAAMHILDYNDGKLIVDGSFREVFHTDDLQLYALFNNKEYLLTNTDRYSLTKYFGISAYKKFTFHLELELNENTPVQSLSFYAKLNKTKIPLKLSFIHHWSKLTLSPENAYWRFNKYIAYVQNDREIVIEHSSAIKTLKSELKYLPKVLMQSRRCFLLRIMYWLTKPYFSNKKIWLMYDKLYKGGDSSEYLYRYCANFKDGITRYYVIDKDTPEYKQMKKEGLKPLKNGSLKHKMAFLNSDIVLITNSNVFPFNGYSLDRSRFIRGFCNFSSMCLQHGLSVQKCAMAQQRIVDNTTMYFLASHHEYDNLNHHAYNYKDFDILRLTGIGRYDGLINDDKKQILISPTWRMYNAMPVTTSEGEQRSYNPEFKHTTYYKIYNDLINNQKLISTAKETGYKIKYLLHPILSAQVNDFKPDDYVEVISSVGDLNYEEILTHSSLMVTDYSGVQFDFSYMKKPIVYFHPSQLPAHYENGCFFYDTMGFGEICTESDELVDLLCNYMKNNCQMKQLYVDRVNEFYDFDDHNNCQRIYNEIIKYQHKVDKNKLRK